MIIPHYLYVEDVEFDVFTHQPTFDAQHLAEELHIPGSHVAKTVLLKAPENRYTVAVLPASKRIDLDAAARALAESHVRLAFEEEIIDKCKDCEDGALPPFGSHYFMDTLVDESLLDAESFVFESNKHNEAIRMNVKDYLRVECPILGTFAR